MIWYMLAEYLASYSEILLMLFTAGVFFERRYPIKKHVLIFVSSSLLMLAYVQICNSISLFSFATTVGWIVCMAGISVWIYKADYVKALAIATIVLVLFCAYDFAVLTSLEILLGYDGTMNYLLRGYSVHRCIYIISSKAVGILALIVFARNGRRKYTADTKMSVALFVGSLVDIVALTYLSTATVSEDVATVKIGVSIANIFILLFFICWVIAIAYSSKYDDKRLENAVISTHLDMLSRDNIQLEATYGTLAKVTHDFKNHLRIIKELAKEEKYDELNAYIGELDGEVKNMQSVTYTGDSFVDAVINTKVHFAREKGIALKVSAEYPRDATFLHMDICAVLVNLLDNAINAAEKANGDCVYLRINSVNQMLMINVSNPSLDPALDKKEKDLNHGYGKKIVASIAEKYSGHFGSSFDDGIYSAGVMLSYNSEIKIANA